MKIVLLSSLLAVACVSSVLANPFATPPNIAATYEQMNAGGHSVPGRRSHTDGSPILLPGNNRWIASHVFARHQTDTNGNTKFKPATNPPEPFWEGGVEHVKSFGSTLNPYQGVEKIRSTCKVRSGDVRQRCVATNELDKYLFVNFGGGLTKAENVSPGEEDVTVNMWLMSVFHPATHSIGGNPSSCAAQYAQNELLAFVHEESVGGINGQTNGIQYGNEGRTRIGLARSVNGGNNWTYLGRIVKPYNDINFNVKGAPYFTEDGYFYVMYDDVETNCVNQ